MTERYFAFVAAAIFLATIFPSKSIAQINEIEQIKRALSRAPQQTNSRIYDGSNEQRRGYFDLAFGDDGCGALSDLIDSAEHSRWFTGSYTILTSLTLRYLPRGRTEIVVPKPLIQKGSNVRQTDDSTNQTVEPDFCGSTIVKSLPTDQELKITIKSTGSFSRFDIGVVFSLFKDIFEISTDIIGTVRPDLAASIADGTRRVRIGNEEKTIADWRTSLTARASAVDKILQRVARAIGDRNVGNRTITMRANTESLVFPINGSEKITIQKRYRWSLLVPGDETGGIRGHKFDAGGVTSDAELVESLGTDADTLARKVDGAYPDVLKQNDKAVMSFCNRLIRSFGAHLQRHDSLALTWLIVRKGALQNNTHSRCFDDDQIAELGRYGITDAPYTGAYGPTTQ